MPDADDGGAWLLLERVRWGGAPPSCPSCGVIGGCRVVAATVAAAPRRTRTGRPTARRTWRCGRCRHEFSVLTGTPWHGTRVPLRAWVRLVELRVLGLATASDAARACDVTRETSRRMISLLDRAIGAAGCSPTSSTEDVLVALLSLAPSVAAGIRAGVPARGRARVRLAGPTIDVGE